MAGYPYRGLCTERKEIRLLYAQSISFQQTIRSSDLLQYEVKHVSLIEEYPVPFYAISYCWGQNPGQSELILNGFRTKIPATAEEALRWTFRLREDPSVPVWIDGICINQDDLEEKGHQVAMMGDVYSKADQVLIWLGRDEDHVAETIASVYAILRYCRKQRKAGVLGPTSGSNNSAYPELTLSTNENPMPSKSTWDSMYRFFEVPYFSRLWPVQEIVLAKNATYFRGYRSMPWDDVAEMAETVMLLGLHYHATRKAPVRTGHHNLGNAGLVAAMRRSSSTSLGQLLYFGTTFTATEPRDKVYALLGMLQNVELPVQSALLLHANYSNSVRDIFINATLAAMTHEKSLVTLRTAQYCAPLDRYDSNLEDTIGIPSWVPRYDLEEKQVRGTPSLIPVQLPGAAAMTIAKFWLDNLSGGALVIRGVFVDVVADKSPTQLWKCEPLRHDMWLRELDCSYESDCKSVRLTYRSQALRESMFNRSTFVTPTGLTGIGPWDYEVGDSVCVMFGCAAPLILRGSGAAWRLMGDAHVDGIMNGEYIERLHQQNLLEARTQWFRIR